MNSVIQKKNKTNVGNIALLTPFIKEDFSLWLVYFKH